MAGRRLRHPQHGEIRRAHAGLHHSTRSIRPVCRLISLSLTNTSVILILEHYSLELSTTTSINVNHKSNVSVNFIECSLPLVQLIFQLYHNPHPFYTDLNA